MKKETLVLGLLLVIVVFAVILTLTNKNDKDIIPKENITNEEIVVEQQPEKLEGDPLITSASTLSWEGSKKIITDWVDTGTIQAKQGSIIFDEETGTWTGGTLVIDMTTIQVLSNGAKGNFERLEGHLSSEDFFDVEKYPTATFVVTEAVPAEEEENTYNVTGDLTIKSTTKSVTFIVTMTQNENKHNVTGTIDIDRSEFDVRYGSESFFDNLGDNIINDIFSVTLDLVFDGRDVSETETSTSAQ